MIFDLDRREHSAHGAAQSSLTLRRVLTALSVCLLSGCMTAKVEEMREAPTRISSTDAVVLLAKPHLEGSGAEDKFMDCLERELVGDNVSADVAEATRNGRKVDARSTFRDSPFQLYADDLFVDAFFPWLEPSTAPASASAFATFLHRPGVSDRVNAIGVRYIVWIDGGTKKTDGGGSIACGAGPGGAGCLGLGWWEKHSDYEATIWDLNQGTSVGSVSTDVKGTSVMIGAIAPIPLISPVQRTACDRMANQLKAFLVGTNDEDGK